MRIIYNDQKRIERLEYTDIYAGSSGVNTLAVVIPTRLVPDGSLVFLSLIYPNGTSSQPRLMTEQQDPQVTGSREWYYRLSKADTRMPGQCTADISICSADGTAEAVLAPYRYLVHGEVCIGTFMEEGGWIQAAAAVQCICDAVNRMHTDCIDAQYSAELAKSDSETHEAAAAGHASVAEEFKNAASTSAVMAGEARDTAVTAAAEAASARVAAADSAEAATAAKTAAELAMGGAVAAGLLPIEQLPDSGHFILPANKYGRCTPVHSVQCSFGDAPNNGYAAEWVLEVVQGSTTQGSIAIPAAVVWGMGIAPTFSPGTTTVCRFYRVGDTFCGEWTVIPCVP